MLGLFLEDLTLIKQLVHKLSVMHVAGYDGVVLLELLVPRQQLEDVSQVFDPDNHLWQELFKILRIYFGGDGEWEYA